MTNEQKQEKASWLRRRLREQHKDDVGSWPFRSFPHNKFFSPLLFRLMIIREGEIGVRLRFGGRLGNPYSVIQDSNGHEIDDNGDPITTKRDFPYGGVMEPGFHIPVGIGGLWSEIAVVPTTLITEEIKPANLVTNDQLELPSIEATLHYRVVDPVRAMTRATNYQETTREFAESSLRGGIGSLRLEQIAGLRGSRSNLILDPDGNSYWPQQLKNIGTKIEGIYITKIDVPDELRQLLAAPAIAKAQASATIYQAAAFRDAAALHEEAGKIYANTPEAREVLYAQQSRSSIWIPGLEKTMEALGKLFKKTP